MLANGVTPFLAARRGWTYGLEPDTLLPEQNQDSFQ